MQDLQQVIGAVWSALNAEVDRATATRVMNRLLVGHPDGINAWTSG